MKLFLFAAPVLSSLAVFPLAAMGPVQALPLSPVTCQDLTSVVLAPPADATALKIDSASLVAAASGLPGYCMVAGHLDTEINFQLKLPANWNGKLLMSGNAGFAGNFGSVFPELNFGLPRLYAVVGTDTGHSGGPDQLLNRPDRIANFQYRAVHLVALAAKEIVQEYYGAAPVHSYFNSCSTGGGQAMLEAQKYPDDFDGVIAGAPQLPDGGFQVWISHAMFPGGPSTGLLPQEKVVLLSTLVLQKCAGLGLVVEGVVADPPSCNFSPLTDLPRCKQGTDGAACFTFAQVMALQWMHEGPVGGGQQLGQEYFFSGAESYDFVNDREFPGSLAFSLDVSGFPGVPALYPNFYGPGLPSFDYANATDDLRYVVFSNPAYQLQTFDFNKKPDLSKYTSALAPGYPSSADLSAFAKAGGKLIEWQGWSDPVFNPMSTVGFYEAGAKAVGGIGQMQAFDRLFLVPGMEHCGYGPGPTDFDVLTVLEQWVEEGVVPKSIIATNRTNRTSRPICAYPDVARLINPSLDPGLASSFTCETR